MASGGTSEGRGLVSNLMAPLRSSERAVDAVVGVAGALRDIRSELSAVREQTRPLGELVPLTRELKRQVKPMPATVERISEQAEPLADLLPALERLQGALEQRLERVHETIQALERDEASLNDRVENLGGEIAGLHETVRGLKADVERITDRVPDASRGPLDKAKELLTGSSNGRPHHAS